MSGNHRAAIERELEDGERLRWVQSPDPEVHARRQRGTMIFGWIWFLFTAGFTYLVTAAGSVLGLTFTLPSWAIGGYLLSSASRARRAARRTVYAVTDRRAMILSEGAELRVRSIYPKDLGSLTLVERSDGSGDVVLRREVALDADDNPTRKDVGFFGISDPRNVKTLLSELAEKAV